MLQWNQTDCQSQLEPVLQINNLTVPFLYYNISDFVNVDLIHIVSAYFHFYIRNYLRCYPVELLLLNKFPINQNELKDSFHKNKNQKYYGKTRFVVENGFFAWLKCFH